MTSDVLVGDENKHVQDKVRLPRGSSTAGLMSSSFGDASTDPLEGVKCCLFSLSSHYITQYHLDPTSDPLPNHCHKDQHHLWPAIGMGNCTSLHYLRLVRSGWATVKVKNINPSSPICPPNPHKYHDHNTKGKKRFIVLNWAKAQTATVPRLLEEAVMKLDAA